MDHKSTSRQTSVKRYNLKVITLNYENTIKYRIWDENSGCFQIHKFRKRKYSKNLGGWKFLKFIFKFRISKIKNLNQKLKSKTLLSETWISFQTIWNLNLRNVRDNQNTLENQTAFETYKILSDITILSYYIFQRTSLVHLWQVTDTVKTKSNNQ